MWSRGQIYLLHDESHSFGHDLGCPSGEAGLQALVQRKTTASDVSSGLPSGHPHSSLSHGNRGQHRLVQSRRNRAGEQESVVHVDIQQRLEVGEIDQSEPGWSAHDEFSYSNAS